MNLTLKEIYRVFNKKFDLFYDDYINGISIDTRTIRRGDIFFAIKGENTDGHNYIEEAFKKGAILAIAEKQQDKRIIKVKNTKKALLQLASYYLKKIKNIKIFAVTGSNGKTTVKEILYKILIENFGSKVVLKSQKSFNNIIGIPLTIFNLNKDHRFLVLEIGMNRPGEIKEIVKLINIDVAIITNIGTSHIGLLKSKRNIAKSKSEIFYGLKKNGLAVLNRDDEFYDFLLKKVNAIVKKCKVVSFGLCDDADFKISEINKNKNKLFFNIKTKKENIKIESKLPGTHNVFNIVAAIAASSYVGIDILKAGRAIINFQMKNMMRLDKKYLSGIIVIQDCYNANVDSFKAALQFLKEQKFKNIVAVIGDMYELGKYTKKFHNDVGKMFTDIELKKLITTGKYADYYCEGFLKAGGKKNKIKILNRKKQISNYLFRILKSGDTLFLKGSRKNRLEEIIDNLKFLYKRR